MTDLSQDSFALAAVISATVAIAVSSMVWIAIWRKISRGAPLVSYESRRQVPWSTVDVVVVFGLYFSHIIVGLVVFVFAPPSESDSTAEIEVSQPLTTTEAADGDEIEEEVDTHHPAIDLLRQDGTLLTWMLCFLAAVVVAPVAEEFLFRLVLQGRLEAAERGQRKSGVRTLLYGAKPILISSILFASVHFRQPESADDPSQLRTALLSQIIWSLLAVAYAVAWLRFRIPDLTAADLGIDFRKTKSDIGLGLLAFLAVACPIYLMQGVLTWLLPNAVPDPIPLFFLALALGFLYQRTHRLLPAIVLHMALNGSSLLMVWVLFSQSGGG
jgi:membrane protease YdiL (CAAX protease family)